MMHLGKSNIWWQLYQRKLTDHDPSFLDTVSATIHDKIQNSGARKKLELKILLCIMQDPQQPQTRLQCRTPLIPYP